jgi:hypothetical protein
MSTTQPSSPPVGGGGGVVDVLAALVAADPAVCDRAGLDELVSRAQRVRGWLDAFDTRIAQRARDLAATGQSESPGSVLANRGRRSQRDAEKAADRANVCAQMPGVQNALEQGHLSADHVDAIANAAATLNDEQRAELADRQDDLVKSGSSKSVEVFERECRDLARSLTRDDGTSRHERNRAARKVRRWADKQTGMCKTLIELDAEADAMMWTAINAAVAAARAKSQDDSVSFDHLQADAVVALITGAQSLDQRVPEVSVLIDLETLLNGMHANSTCETGFGEPVPPDTIRRMCCDAHIIPIVLGGDGEVLDVGRRSRLATRSQRVALRAMYRTCGMPGCDVPFDRCQIHHVDEWKADQGPTALDKLLPLCTRDHHLVHDDGWTLHLEPDRRLTVTRPDGVIHFMGPTTTDARRNAGPQPTAAA